MNRERQTITPELNLLFQNTPPQFEGLVRRDPNRLKEFELPELTHPTHTIHISAKDVFTHALLAPKGMETRWLTHFYEEFVNFGGKQQGYHTLSRDEGVSQWMREILFSRNRIHEAGMIFTHHQGTIVLSFGLPHISSGDWRDIVSSPKWDNCTYIVQGQNQTIVTDYLSDEYDHDTWIANLRAYNRTNPFKTLLNGENITGFTGRMLADYSSQLNSSMRRFMHEAHTPTLYTIKEDTSDKIQIGKYTLRSSKTEKERWRHPIQVGISMYPDYAELNQWDGRHRISVYIGNRFLRAEIIMVTPGSNIPKRVRFRMYLNDENSLISEKRVAPLNDRMIDEFRSNPWNITPLLATLHEYRYPLQNTDIVLLANLLRTFDDVNQSQNENIYEYLSSASYLLSYAQMNIHSGHGQ
jgi:hypothetical protein